MDNADFINSRGRDIRREYFFTYEIGGIEITDSFVACYLNDAYELFEKKLGKPEPQIIAVWSKPFLDTIQTPKQ